MKLRVRRPLVPRTDGFTVEREDGGTLYLVRTAPGGPTVLLTPDEPRRELGLVRNRPGAFPPTVELYWKGVYEGFISRSWVAYWPRCRFCCPEFAGWQITCAFPGWRALFLDHRRREMAAMDWDPLRSRDGFALRILCQEDPARVLLLALAVDALRN